MGREIGKEIRHAFFLTQTTRVARTDDTTKLHHVYTQDFTRRITLHTVHTCRDAPPSLAYLNTPSV